jgi:hypothetical protein
MPMKRRFAGFFVIAALACLALGAPVAARAQDRNAALKTAQGYLKKVISTNSANATAPKPNAAEQAALKTLKAQVTEDEILELDKLPPKPLAEIRSVNDLNVIMAQLTNPAPYLKKAAMDAREAERSAQTAGLKAPPTPRLVLSRESNVKMNTLGIILDDNNQIVAGGKVFNPMTADAAQFAEAAGKTDFAGKKEQAAYMRNMQDVLREIRDKLAAMQKAR